MNEWEWRLLEDRAPAGSLSIAGVEVKPGDRVRLRPGKRGDVMDIALAGKTAMIESIEQDYEGKFHVCVVADDDPGRDIGIMRQPGHRFFFDPEEVEPLPVDQAELDTKAQTPSILIAGIGNIFLGDDAFGVEVAQRLASRKLPERVKAIDFGIRGFDLAYALLDGSDVTILVDGCPRGDKPGSLYVIEPDLNSLNAPDSERAAVDAHSMNPMNVIRMAKSMGGELKRILLVGCEPATLGPEEGQMGLSEPVAAAVDEAAKLVESLVEKIRNGEWPQ
ncbi:MAG TPA: hydrogenase maturation protease [Candidatus Acidoferrales bacterium]|nr:hydrogenase maturation protease [Candidatus Acidoferrales bacterium]